MFFINHKDGFVVQLRNGDLGHPTRSVRKATPFKSFKEADEFAKAIHLNSYAVLRSALHVSE